MDSTPVLRKQTPPATCSSPFPPPQLQKKTTFRNVRQLARVALRYKSERYWKRISFLRAQPHRKYYNANIGGILQYKLEMCCNTFLRSSGGWGFFWPELVIPNSTEGISEEFHLVRRGRRLLETSPMTTTPLPTNLCQTWTRAREAADFCGASSLWHSMSGRLATRPQCWLSCAGVCRAFFSCTWAADLCKGAFPEGVLGTKCRKLVTHKVVAEFVAKCVARFCTSLCHFVAKTFWGKPLFCPPDTRQARTVTHPTRR